MWVISEPSMMQTRRPLFTLLSLVVLLLLMLMPPPSAHAADKVQMPRRRKRQNHKAAGIAHSKRGDMAEAITAFRRAIVANLAFWICVGIDRIQICRFRQRSEELSGFQDFLTVPPFPVLDSIYVSLSPIK